MSLFVYKISMDIENYKESVFKASIKILVSPSFLVSVPVHVFLSPLVSL